MMSDNDTRNEPVRVHELPTVCGFRPRDLAKRYRVGMGKVLSWIRSGELRAINVAVSLLGRPRFVVLPESLAEFERRRDCSPKPKVERRRRRPASKDWFPEFSEP